MAMPVPQVPQGGSSLSALIGTRTSTDLARISDTSSGSATGIHYQKLEIPASFDQKQQLMKEVAQENRILRSVAAFIKKGSVQISQFTSHIDQKAKLVFDKIFSPKLNQADREALANHLNHEAARNEQLMKTKLGLADHASMMGISKQPIPEGLLERHYQELAETTGQLDICKSNLKTLNQNLNTLVEQHGKLTAELESLTKKPSGNKEAIKELKNKITSVKEQIGIAEQSVKQGAGELHQITAKYEQLNALNTQMDGLYQAAKARDPKCYQKVGMPEFHISPNEAKQISSFITNPKNRENWQQLRPGEHERITWGGLDGVPRTLDIFVEDGQLHVMVLCKQKAGMQKLGEGSGRIAKAAVDWETGKGYADITLKSKGVGSFGGTDVTINREKNVLDIVGGKKGIVGKMVGMHQHQSVNIKTGEVKDKTSFYQELYVGGSLFQKLTQQKEPLSHMEKRNMIRQLLVGVRTLNENNVAHRDLKTDNIYIDNGQLKIGDFDNASINRPDLREFNDIEKLHAFLMRGNDTHKSPECHLLLALNVKLTKTWQKDSRFDIESNDEQKIKLKNEIESSKQRDKELLLNEVALLIKGSDAFSAGLLCAEILTGDIKSHKLDDGRLEETSELGLEVKNSIEHFFDPLNYSQLALSNKEELYQGMQKEIDKVLDRAQAKCQPEDKELFSMVRQLLKADPAKRLSPAVVLNLMNPPKATQMA